MSIKTWLDCGGAEEATCGGSVGSIASYGESFSLNVTVSKSQTQENEEGRKIVADIVQVLLGINKFVEGGDAVVRQEVVVGSGV